MSGTPDMYHRKINGVWVILKWIQQLYIDRKVGTLVRSLPNYAILSRYHRRFYPHQIAVIPVTGDTVAYEIPGNSSPRP